MTTSKQDKLIEKFKNLESQLVELLKLEPLEIDSTTQGVKTKIKSYIKKVNKVRTVFDEYEKLADEIEKMSASDDNQMVSAVVDLRESSIEEKQVEEYVDELVISDQGAKKVKKKKTQSISKEL